MFPLEPRHVPEFVPPQAMAHGGTIIRPGAVAWGGIRDPAGDAARDRGRPSGEVVERALAAVTRSPGELPGLLAALAASRLWVPLPDVRPFTDGTVVQLPLISYQDADFVPCFTSVQRLAGWTGLDRPGQRAGDPRLVPHVVLSAVGLARRLPGGLGLALNPDGAPGLPLYPECVPYLARLRVPAVLSAASGLPHRGLGMAHLVAQTGVRFLIGHPPAEPFALLAQLRAALAVLPLVRQASRAWLAVRGQGEGLVISVTLDDPASEPAHAAVVEAIERAAAAVPLRVPFALDVKFPGESPVTALALVPAARPGGPGASAPDVIDAWIAGNTRPFYARDPGARVTEVRPWR